MCAQKVYDITEKTDKAEDLIVKLEKLRNVVNRKGIHYQGNDEQR